MFLRFRFVLLAIILPCKLFVSCNKEEEETPKEAPYDVIIDFQDVTFPEGLLYNNISGSAGKFTEGIVSFQNVNGYDEDWDYPYWYGFAYSKKQDVTTQGPENQWSAYVMNDDENNIFMVGYIDDFFGEPVIEINFSQPVKDLSFDIANSTYVALSMINGDDFAKQFTETDWFLLTIKATSTEAIETITMKLGDGTKITNVWNNIQVQSSNITKLEFYLTSSDVTTYGDVTYMNTPAYFCIDNIKARIVK